MIALIALVLVCAVWGSTFLIVQRAVSRMPVMDFLAVRFIVAVAVMFALRPNCLRGMTRLGYFRAGILAYYSDWATLLKPTAYVTLPPLSPDLLPACT